MTVTAVRTEAVRHLHVGDFGKDLDDEIAALVAAYLVREGLIDLRGTVANLHPAVERARLARGTYLAVGLDVPVAVGTDCQWVDREDDPYQFAAPYLAPAASLTLNGESLFLSEARSAPDHSLHLVLMSGFTDAAGWLYDHPDLFRQKVASVTMMSGVSSPEARLRPDRTANNDFDFPAAAWLYACLHKDGIPTTVLTRDAAYAAAVPRSFYDDLAASGHPVAQRLVAVQHRTMTQFWKQCNLPKDDPERQLPWGPLDNPRTASWFLRTFCDGQGEDVGSEGDIWPYVQRFCQYDALTVLAACPATLERFFSPTVSVDDGHARRIIGISAEEHGVKDPADLVAFLAEAVLSSLTHTG